MFQLFFVVLAVAGALIHLALSRSRRSNAAAIAETFLLYFFVVYIGGMMLVSALAHIFWPAVASASIGWSTSPYEYEVGVADFAAGTLGILCIWFRGNFWLATAIANTLMLEGDAIGHIRQEVQQNNHAPNNSGVFLYLEIVVPLLILFLTLYHRKKVGETG